MVGYSYQKIRRDDGMWASSVGFSSDDLGSNNLNLGNLPEGYNPFTDYPRILESILVSFYGRVGYNLSFPLSAYEYLLGQGMG